LLLATTLTIVLSTTETLHGTTTKEGTTTTSSCECECEKETILLQDIKELAFLKGAQTLSRRQPAIQQLECVGGSAKGSHEPNSVRCVNIGHLEPHWRCEATLEDSVQLGSSTVSCEGYRSNDDPYVLRGSCGLAYTLEYTHWGDYLWGKAVRAFSILVLNPLKWILFAGFTAFVALVLLAAIRRPTRRHRMQEQQSEKTQSGRLKRHAAKEVDYEIEDYEMEDEGVDTLWTGRLRPRSTPVGKGTR